MSQILVELEEGVRDVAAMVGPSVVGIGRRRGVGSGVVVAPGIVLTNAHNLRGEEATITFADGRTETAHPAGVDMDGDLAVLSVETGPATPVEWAGSIPGLGAAVFALANPGGRGLRVTFGLVSGTERSFRGPRGRRIRGSVEHTSPLLPGSSGGPLVDRSGGLVGINTNRLGEGFYLAIPADESLRQRVDALARGVAPRHPLLGVGLVPPHAARRLRRAVGLPEADGLLVRHVEEGSPAEAAGLSAGDLIVEVGGRAAAGIDELQEALDAAGAGGSLALKLLRGTEERSVQVTLAAGEAPSE